MSTAPSPEIWNNILKGNVEKDDPLWTEYLDKAAVFDVRMVDEWNNIVDVLLVYVALFITVLASFITNSFSQFQRNPADITNDLLVGIYNQLVAQSNKTPITPVDPNSFFNQSQADYDAAVGQNALLYTSLSLSIIVSVIALAAKLWLVSYSQQAFSVGSPYDRAMKRQEAYNGVLVWNMGGGDKYVTSRPAHCSLLVWNLCVVRYFMSSPAKLNTYASPSSSVSAVQVDIGNAVGILLGVGLMFLAYTSFYAAIFPGCPFRSAFSDVIRFIVEKLQKSKLPPRHGPLRYLSFAGIIILLLGITVFPSLVLLSSESLSTPITPLILIPLFVLSSIAPSAIGAHWVLQFFNRKAHQKPQKYKISYVAALAFFIVSLWVISFFYLAQPLACGIGIAVVGLVVMMLNLMSQSMTDTREIDAIAWLLITTPQYPAAFFKKAGQMTEFNSIGGHYRPRLLNSLMPLLSSFITLYHTLEHHTGNSDTHSPEPDDVLNGQLRTNLSLVDEDMDSIDEDPHLKNLEIYIACLARLSEFTDYKGKYYRLWEDARRHPKLDQPLIDKLVKLANPQRQSLVGLRSAATKVLINYELDMEGNSLRSPTTVLEMVATDLRQEATSVSNDNGLNSQEPVDPSTRIEPATHVEPPSVATSVLNDSELNSQEQRHSELYRPVEASQWTTVERRRARSLDSLGRVPKNSSDNKNLNRQVTTDQAQTVEATASNLTDHQKSSISRRQKKKSAYRESFLSDRGEGPFKSKGKNVDPREWGQVNISLESLDIEAQDAALNSFDQAKKMTTHRKDEYYEERNPPATRRRSKQASRPADSHPAAQIAKDSYLGSALNKDPSTRIEPATHVELPSAATSILNESGLNGRERGHSGLYRPEDPATRVDSEPVSAATSMFNDSELDSQEQGLQELYRPVNLAMRVESEECEIEKIEEVKRQVGDEEIELEEVKRD